MQYTPNFNLAKPDGTDSVDVSVLNGNMDIIDSSMGGGQSSLHS